MVTWVTEKLNCPISKFTATGDGRQSGYYNIIEKGPKGKHNVH